MCLPGHPQGAAPGSQGSGAQWGAQAPASVSPHPPSLLLSCHHHGNTSSHVHLSPSLCQSTWVGAAELLITELKYCTNYSRRKRGRRSEVKPTCAPTVSQAHDVLGSTPVTRFQKSFLCRPPTPWLLRLPLPQVSEGPHGAKGEPV